MSNLPEQIAWESGIHQLEEADRAKAGPGGVLNIQANQLANRTRWLRVLVESASDYREYTFYKSESDPDGTISGLANTPAGKLFRVVQGLTDNFSIIYYLNDAGVAVPLTAFLGPGSVINNVREYPTLPVAQNDADAGNILDGSKCWVDNTDDTALAVEYINNGGTLTATGRVMPSAYNPELSVVSAGMLLKIVSDVYSLTAGSYYTADGVLHTDGGSTWGMYKFPIKKGQWVKYIGPMGITTGSESIPVIAQLDSNQGWVSSLRTVNATGAAGVTFQTLYGQATQDGFIAVRGRTAETS
ncbi:TPA: hypothetical protein ACGBT9_005291, partial [Klebsiella variicola]